MHITTSVDFCSDPKHVEKLWSSSYSCLMKGLELFKKTGNTINQALLYANLGQLMSVCARTHSQKTASEKVSTEREFTSQERLYYNKACEFFVSGKQVCTNPFLLYVRLDDVCCQVLKKRMIHPGVWSNLVVKLSGVYLITCQMIQERPPLSSISQPEVDQQLSCDY